MGYKISDITDGIHVQWRSEDDMRRIKKSFQRQRWAMLRRQLYPFWIARQRINRWFFLPEERRYVNRDEFLQMNFYVEDLGDRYRIINNRFEFQVLYRKLTTQQNQLLKRLSAICLDLKTNTHKEIVMNGFLFPHRK